MFKRPVFNEIVSRLNEKRRFIQILMGPRQTGKTTLAQQILEKASMQNHYATADEPMQKDRSWIEQQWEVARLKIKSQKDRVLLILDEIHKIPYWNETVKRLWDEDTASKRQVYVVLLGSSSLLMSKGLGDSLAGRYEIIYIPHWSFPEMRDAFGWDVNKYIFYGGYPGSAALIQKTERFKNYVLESIIETIISKDILQMTRVDKPALLRALFQIGCNYSGQILSFQKILGQLQDAGNTVTLAHYLQLLDSAGLLTGLQKYAGNEIRKRSSSPKFQVYNNAFLSALSDFEYDQTMRDGEKRGRLVESCVGAHLINSVKGKNIRVFYWKEGSYEADFILKKADNIIALEVKSGRKKIVLNGMEKFSEKFRVNKKLLVGTGGIPVDEFLLMPVEKIF
jgi:predicted AAA+ superfamily ATPase